MTVRWKPLLVLSGVFVLVAIGGLLALAVVRGAGGTDGILAKARADRKARRYPEAEVQYRRALQVDARNPAIQVEFASLYGDWIGSAPADRLAKLAQARHACLADAARLGPGLAEPRRALLADALERDDHVEAMRWAGELVRLDPADPTAHFVLARDLLAESSPNIAEIRRHLAIVARPTPRPARADLLAATVAQASRDDAELRATLGRSRRPVDLKSLHVIDALALFQLRAWDIKAIADPDSLPDRIKGVIASAEGLTAGRDVPATRIEAVSRGMEQVARSLAQVDAPAGTKARERLDAMGTEVEATLDRIFRRSLDAEGGADLGVFFAYADHLRFRDDRAGCLGVIDRAFRSPGASRQASGESALRLHALAVHAVLTDTEDKGRFEKAEPHIRPLIEGASPKLRGFGHMYQGQIELERLNLGQKPESDGVTPAEVRARASALAHLKAAAEALPDLAEAQARYGVALILGREAEMGRIYLQKAAQKGDLEPQYQVWAAWAMIHGGYPEYAEPIVAGLLGQVEAGKLPREMAGVLHLIAAEVHQSRKTPAELVKAVESYNKAFANGQKPTAAAQVRLAQIELMLDRPDAALARLDAVDRAGLGFPDSEVLAVNILRTRSRPDDARARLAKARAKHPRSPELAALDAEILVAEKKPAEADRLLEGFLAREPEGPGLVELRSQILDELLGKPVEARALLAASAERSDRTAPLVRLAQLDIRRRDFDAAGASIARLRSRWKEAAVADILDAQVALARGNGRLATTFYDAALKKDPKNKLVRYWKAQLEGSTNPKGAAQVYESLAREGSVKEVEDGLSLMTAAQSALAGLQLESGDVDGAIARYQGLLKGGAAGSATRDLRWKLVAANLARKQWPVARAELEALLDDPAAPSTAEERVAAAMYYRNNGEADRAAGLIDSVLSASPGHPWAVTVRAQMLVADRKLAEARGLVRRALDAPGDRARPAAFYLLLAAIENETPPVSDGLGRALAAVDEGLKALPGSVELVQAKCRLLGLLGRSPEAIAMVGARAQEDPKGPFARLLVGLHRDVRDYEAAERAAADVLRASPKDAAMAALLVRMVAAQGIEARGRGDRAAASAIEGRVGALIRDDRARFPDDTAFVQLDCERAARLGETGRAVSLAHEIDKMAPGSTTGPLLRAQVYAGQNRPREVAAAYAEALERDPRQPDVRLLLAQAQLQARDYDQASRQARTVLDLDPDNSAALLVEARALAENGASPPQVASNRAAAIEMLEAAIRRRPGFTEAYQLVAQVHALNGARDRSVEALKAGLKAVPTDGNGLSIAIRVLCDPAGTGRPADPARVDDARALAEQYARADTTGQLALAAAIGFHRSGQLDLALPWAERAGSMSDAPNVHLNLGDLLLALAENGRGPARDDHLKRALGAFDRVLKSRPLDVEATNNKAWILHSYLGRSPEALGLAEGLVARVDATSLPAEFYDTLGSIQEAVGRARDAEESYRLGLAKAPEMPVLNYHMGRLIAADKARAPRAASYLAKAHAGRDRLSPEMAAEVATLVDKAGR